MTDDWRVKVIPMNFVLEQHKKTKPSKKYPDGRMQWVRYGYYSSLENALRAIPSALAQSPTLTTLEEYTAEWRRIAASVQKKFDETTS